MSEANIINAVKKYLLLVIIALLIGLAVGYFFGYDRGFEKAAKILVK